MRLAGGDVAGRAAAVARLQAPAQFAGEEVGRGVAVADLQDGETAPLAALPPAAPARGVMITGSATSSSAAPSPSGPGGVAAGRAPELA